MMLAALLSKQEVKYPYGRPAEGADVLWRCEARCYSICIDPDADLYGTSGPEIELQWWPVRKRTPCGAWLDGRFVRLTAFKRWACNTENEALASLIARRKRQTSILKTQLARAENELALAEAAYATRA